MSEAQFWTIKSHPFFGVWANSARSQTPSFSASAVIALGMWGNWDQAMHAKCILFFEFCVILHVIVRVADPERSRFVSLRGRLHEMLMNWFFLRPSLHCYYVCQWQENNRGCNLQSIFGGASFDLADHFSHSVTLSQGWHSMKFLWLFFQPSEGVTSQMAVSKTWAVALTLEPNSAGLQRWDIERNRSKFKLSSA